MSKRYLQKTTLVVASGNLGKVKEFSYLLSEFPFLVKPKPEDIQIDETGDTFVDNARLKAFSVANITREWTLADDSGLCVNALGGAPGIHSARYAETDEDRIKRLLQELKPFNDRSAYFSSALCLAAPDNKILVEVQAKCEGLITKEPRGSKGFGYDPIFEVNNCGLTFAEMKLSEKQALSHRGKAFSMLEERLANIL